MNRLFTVAVLILTLATLTGCKSNPGSREFIPGKGWTPTP